MKFFNFLFPNLGKIHELLASMIFALYAEQDKVHDLISLYIFGFSILFLFFPKYLVSVQFPEYRNSSQLHWYSVSIISLSPFVHYCDVK
ncbi:MAG: hypothetical protein ABJB85_08810, partial [Nitrososphaerota archaeon]